MIVKSFHASTISLTPIRDRWYRLEDTVIINVKTDVGVFVIKIDAGFTFDGRSGGKLIDFIVPNLGTQKELACWLVHDALGHDIGVSFAMTNELLYGMLRCCGYSFVRAKIVYHSVNIDSSWFGQPNGPTELEERNIKKIKFNWIDRL